MYLGIPAIVVMVLENTKSHTPKKNIWGIESVIIINTT